MCDSACIDFATRALTEAEVRDRAVLEVGSLDVNGSVRRSVETLGPARYLGVDLAPGPGVDEVVDARHLVERYGPASFDVVISTELLEHVRDWRRVIDQLKRVLRPGGTLLITTRSYGHPYHGFPYDFWRYELDDARRIFADLEDVVVESDAVSPGVFVSARMPTDWTPAPLDDVELYSMLSHRRAQSITTAEEYRFRAHFRIRRMWARGRYLGWEGLCRIAPRPLKEWVKRALGRTIPS